MKKVAKTKRGSTLLEILLYLTISGVVLFAIISFALQIMGINKKTSDMQEIQTSMEFVSNKLSYIIQISSSIDELNSILDQNNGKLSLNLSDLTKSPTAIYLENQSIYLKEGNNIPIKMNSDFVKCTQLKFTEIVALKAPKQIMIDYQCEPINSDLSALKQGFSQHTSVSLRQ